MDLRKSRERNARLRWVSFVVRAVSGTGGAGAERTSVLLDQMKSREEKNGSRSLPVSIRVCILLNERYAPEEIDHLIHVRFCARECAVMNLNMMRRCCPPSDEVLGLKCARV